jgi:hypothetical protein
VVRNDSYWWFSRTEAPRDWFPNINGWANLTTRELSIKIGLFLYLLSTRFDPRPNMSRDRLISNLVFDRVLW